MPFLCTSYLSEARAVMIKWMDTVIKWTDRQMIQIIDPLNGPGQGRRRSRKLWKELQPPIID